jgi:ABC-2 type transport system permease protein
MNRSGVLWAFNDTWLMAKRSTTHIIRSLDQVASLILFPVMFMLLNRYVLGGAIHTGISYANYLFAGILVQTLAFGANYTTINLAVDLKEGIVDRFRSLPMTNGSLVAGHIAADMVRNVISGVIIVLMGFLVGFRPNASFVEWLMVFGLVAVGHYGLICKEPGSGAVDGLCGDFSADVHFQRFRANPDHAARAAGFCREPAADAGY